MVVVRWGLGTWGHGVGTWKKSKKTTFFTFFFLIFLVFDVGADGLILRSALSAIACGDVGPGNAYAAKYSDPPKEPKKKNLLWIGSLDGSSIPIDGAIWRQEA